MKGFTKKELKEWCVSELGDGYSVEIANKENAGDGYDTAVVVTKNNENAARGSVSELGQPTRKGASLANFGAKVARNIERGKRLGEIVSKIDKNGSLGAHQLLHEINVAFDTTISKESAKRKSTRDSEYHNLGNGVTLRVSNHQGNANTFDQKNNPKDNYGIVIKLSPSRFKDKDSVDYLEYVYYPD